MGEHDINALTNSTKAINENIGKVRELSAQIHNTLVQVLGWFEKLVAAINKSSFQQIQANSKIAVLTHTAELKSYSVKLEISESKIENMRQDYNRDIALLDQRTQKMQTALIKDADITINTMDNHIYALYDQYYGEKINKVLSPSIENAYLENSRYYDNCLTRRQAMVEGKVVDSTNAIHAFVNDRLNFFSSLDEYVTDDTTDKVQRHYIPFVIKEVEGKRDVVVDGRLNAARSGCQYDGSASLNRLKDMLTQNIDDYSQRFTYQSLNNSEMNELKAYIKQTLHDIGNQEVIGLIIDNIDSLSLNMGRVE